ncbi:MAG: restriction endonuclease subunit S [Candidatus Thiothrix moscowensis]|nr:restriction endonuclease subunit S [Candidatus Thiothrix moscowensis]
MQSEWRETTLGEVLELKRGYDLPQKNRIKGDVPLISSAGVSDFHNEAKVKAPGVVTGRYGTIGEVFYSDKDFWPLNTTLYVRDFKGNDVKFIYYFLKTIDYLQYSDKAAVPGVNRNHLHLAKVSIPEDIEEQKAIAHILGSLDDKIELNRQMNATLEAMAQALFKSWFVDFDPVLDNALAAGNPIPDELQDKAAAREALGDARNPLPEDIAALFPAAFVWTEEMGWIPEGWEVSQLGKFVDVKRGGSPRPIHDYLVPDGLPWVKISDATASEFRFLGGTKEFIKPEGLKKTVLLKSGSLILSNSATPGLPLFLDLDACIHDGWLYFPKKEKFSDLYLYQLFLVIRQELIQQGNGSVFTNLKTDILKSHSLIVPNQNLLDKFDVELSAISQRIHSLHIENKALTQLRDTLLPKLLSGELRIPDAEKLVEEIL